MPTASTSCRSASSASPSAIVLLPELSRALKAGNLIEAANLQNRSVEFTLFLTLPAAAALLVISEPIVRVLYERGAFAADRSTPIVAGDPRDLRPRPAGLRADQGVHARLSSPARTRARR